MARRRRNATGLSGLLVVDKAPGMTSHDVVDRARRRLGERRIGHSGTLDPPATGVLLLGVGPMTRTLRWLTALPKTYTGELVLGSTTTTLDDTGEVLTTVDASGVTLEQVAATAAMFVGDIEQIPPMVSAVKVDGRRLHEVARAGEEIERAPRPVTVYRYDVAAADEPGVFRIEVECSSGTYVRTLADDVGRELGVGGHLRGLRRTAIGSFTEAEAAPVEDAELLDPVTALRDLPSVEIDAEDAAKVRNGGRLNLGESGHDTAVIHGGTLLAVYEPHRGSWKPAVVLAGGG